MAKKRTHDEWFDALHAVLTENNLWRQTPPYESIQLHPDDFKRLQARDYGDPEEKAFAAKLRGRLRYQANQSLVLSTIAGTFSIIIWRGTTVPRGWVGVEVSPKAIKRVRLRYPDSAQPKPKKPKKERPTRFERDFEV